MANSARREVFSRIGGHRTLDLLNTVEWRLSSTRLEEDLRDFDDVVRWASQTGTITPSDGDALRLLSERSIAESADETGRVRRLREAIYATLFEDASPEILVEEHQDAVSRGTLVPGETGWRWELPVDLALPRRAIAVDAVDVLRHTDLSGLAQCQDAECGWVFLDSSPRRNRRWCVSADCGNRNRARDFYRRTRAASRS